jgi:hypothetical protein
MIHTTTSGKEARFMRLFTPLYNNISHSSSADFVNHPKDVIDYTLARADADKDKDHRYNTGRKINIQIHGASPIPCDDAHPTNIVLVWPLAHYGFVPACTVQCRDTVHTSWIKKTLDTAGLRKNIFHFTLGLHGTRST